MCARELEVFFGSVWKCLEVLFFVNGVKVDGRECLQQHKGNQEMVTEKFSKRKEGVSEREDQRRSNK